MHVALEVLIKAVASFFILFIFSKLLGKKQIAQLDFVDYVVGISIGSIAAEMAFDTDRPFYSFIIGMAVFFVLSLITSFLGRKGTFLKKLINGRPLVLIYEGKLDYKSLKKSKLDINDLLCLCRAKDYFDLSKIQYAILETNGTLSIVPIGTERPAVAKDLPVEITPPSLPNYLVVDGHISYSGLSELNKDEAWLYPQLGISDKAGLKKILVAQWDEESQNMITHLKDNG